MLALRLLVALALLVAGLAAAGVAWVRAERNAEEARDVVADSVSERVASTAATAIAGMGGGAALVPADGPVSPDQFVAFQREVAEVSSLGGLGYAPVVTEAERPGFEAALGRQITELNEQGFVPAPLAPTYWPVELISPPEPELTLLLGADMQSSEFTSATAATARDTGDTLLTEPVTLTPELTLFFIIKPLYRPNLPLDSEAERQAAHAGFLASAYTATALGQGIAEGLPDGVRYSVRDGDMLLVESDPGPGGPDVERRLTVGGREWIVDVEDTRPVTHDFSWFLIAITLLLSGGLLFLVVRGLRHERALARISRLVGSTADLAQQLAGAATADEVAVVIRDAVSDLFGASSSRLVVVDPPPPGRIPDDAATTALDDADPVTRASRQGSPVLVRERGHHVAALPLEIEPGVVGAVVEIVWSERVEFDGINVATLRTVAELCEQTLRRAGATDQVAVRADRLAVLAEGLAGAATVAQVSDRITDLGRLPVGASAASLGLIDPYAGVLRVNHGATVDDRTRNAFASPALSERLVFTDAARTGEPVIVADYAEYERLYPDAEQSAAGLGRGARAALPLRVGDEVIGAIVFAWPTGRVFDAELMSTLSTIAKMATQSVIRARLTEEQLDDARRSRELADFAQRVARVRTAEELVQAVIDRGGAPAQALYANVGLLDRGLNRLAVQPHPSFERAQVEQFGVRSLDDEDLPGVTAIRTGEPVVLASREEIEASYPGRFAEATEAVGVAASVHLPLIGTDTDTLGTLGFGWDSPQQFSPATIATLRTLAELCAQTLDRVRLGEAEHDLVSSLQHRVVRPLPAAAGLEVAQRYQPAARSVGMGGDWYEGIPLVDGRYALVVGDIAGHGINAVSDMIQVRAVVGALLRSGVPLGDVFSQATGLLDDARTTVTATAGIVVVDPSAGQLSYVMAGHLPPVVAAPDGTLTTLDEGRQPLLGLPVTPVVPGSAPFPPGSTLLAYTDGLIERRSETIDESLQRLLGVMAGAADAPIEDLADDLLVRCLAGEDPGDDVALVVIRNQPAS